MDMPPSVSKRELVCDALLPPVFHWLLILDASNHKRLPGLHYPVNTGPSVGYLSPCRSSSSYQVWVEDLFAFALNFFPLAASQNVGLQGLIKWLSWEHHVAIRVFHLLWHLFPFPASVLFSMALQASWKHTSLFTRKPQSKCECMERCYPPKDGADQLIKPSEQCGKFGMLTLLTSWLNYHLFGLAWAL